MKILHLAYNDVSGVPSRWAKAHCDAGHEAWLLFELEHDYGYSYAASGAIVERWSSKLSDPLQGVERLDGTLAWADAIMVYDHPYYLRVALAAGKPVLFRALGTTARENADELRDLLHDPLVLRASTGTLDLAHMLDIEHAGAPYPLLPPASSERQLLVHAPSNRHLKNTNTLLTAAAQTNWTVDVVERTTNDALLARKATSLGILDSGPGSLPDGYGVNSVEAMAMGLPAIAGASHDIAALLQDLGCPVLFVENEGELWAALQSLHDAEERKRLGLLGTQFVADFHNPEQRVHEDDLALQRTKAVA